MLLIFVSYHNTGAIFIGYNWQNTVSLRSLSDSTFNSLWSGMAHAKTPKLTNLCNVSNKGPQWRELIYQRGGCDSPRHFSLSGKKKKNRNKVSKWLSFWCMTTKPVFSVTNQQTYFWMYSCLWFRAKAGSRINFILSITELLTLIFKVKRNSCINTSTLFESCNMAVYV